jgi:hypothetical protein
MRINWGRRRSAPIFVIPAEAGIQGEDALWTLWIPAFAGMTRR